jgi:hypothetical protein
MPLALLWRVAGFFMPGGWLVQAAVAVAQFVPKFLYWLCADIADAFKEPWRFCVRTICGIAILLLGWHFGADHMRHDRDLWRTAHAALIEDARIANEENRQKEAAALKARQDAMAKIAVEAKKVKTVPVGPSAADPGRVQQPRRPAKSANSGG